MPKTRLGESVKKSNNVKVSKAADDRILVALIQKNLAIVGMQKKELAVLLHMGESTLHSRCKNPEDFRRSELRTLFEVLQFSEEDKAQIKW